MSCSSIFDFLSLSQSCKIAKCNLRITQNCALSIFVILVLSFNLSLFFSFEKRIGKMSCCSFSYFLSLSQSCKMYLSIFLYGNVTILHFLSLSLEEKNYNIISIFIPFFMFIDLCAPLPMFVSCTKSEEEEI